MSKVMHELVIYVQRRTLMKKVMRELSLRIFNSVINILA
jgi:hypothetical protein